MTGIFVSYSRSDKLLVDRLVNDLRNTGHDIWLDKQNIEPGEKWWEAIFRGINKASALIVCLSPDALESEWIRRELYVARGLGKFIIPVSVRACGEALAEQRDLAWLKDLQIIDLEPDYDRAVADLSRALKTRPQQNAYRPLFAQSDSAEFSGYMEALVSRARSFTLIGTGLNILSRDPFTRSCMERAAAGEMRLEIYLADPYSPDVETRLIEEEIGDLRPPVGQAGMIRRLETLLNMWHSLGEPESISINLFTHYPTFALMIVDSEYFVYPYGYACLGNFSPVFQFSADLEADRSVVAYLNAHYHRVQASALPARQVAHIRQHHRYDPGELQPFAVYFVPPAESPLYAFGSRVLGYDVRAAQPVSSPWAAFAGGAADFGFHLTISDALYFLNRQTIALVKASIRFAVQGLHPFRLTDFEIRPFPNEQSLAICLNDPTGTLEVLHYEMIQRVYRRAIASNYSLGLAAPDRDRRSERANLLIKRYHAPYIMKSFNPHFTLLSGIPPQERERVRQEVESAFREEVDDTAIMVEKLALMTRPDPRQPWIIDEEIELQ